MSKTRVACFAALLALALNPPCGGESVPKQQKEESAAYVRYRRVLDLVFPRAEMGRSTIVLRVTPTSSPDCQISIVETNEGTYEVTYSTLAAANGSVATRVADIVEQTHEVHPQRVSKMIEVVTRRVHLAAPVLNRLLKSFAQLAISPVFEKRVVLDGTRYELWVTTYTGQQLYVSIDEADSADEKVRDPLVRWMNQVRNVVANSLE
jgi:hypothetical protein